MANVIATMLKDEDNLLEDFVIHHVDLGFDRIIFFDDGSAAPVEKTLSNLPERYREKTQVERIDVDYYGWRSSNDAKYFEEDLYKAWARSKQMYFANLAIRRYLQPTDWVAYTDVDEFLWLGAFPTIDAYREEIQRRGFQAVILTMVLYGHGYNLTPPQQNNICSFIWRADNFFGHGKFFAQVGALEKVKTPHFPTLFNPALVCDRNFNPRTEEYDWNRPKVPDFNTPHLKHYTVLDAYSCFRRRIRARVSAIEPVAPTDGAWVARMNLLWSTSIETDITLATSLIHARAKAGISVTSHVQGLAKALEVAKNVRGIGPNLDFEYLRQQMNIASSVSDAETLFTFVKQPKPDMRMLRFLHLPVDFTIEEYRSFNNDIRYYSPRQLELHYLNYGMKENRPYKKAAESVA